MIRVWTDEAETGLLDRDEPLGSTFAYLPGTPQQRAVSVTMPVRLPSWTVSFGLPPIFEMNLPEGFVRERLRLAFAKATGTFDELDLLSVSSRRFPASAACSQSSSCEMKALSLKPSMPVPASRTVSAARRTS
jgi:hypothetical protein